MSNANSEHSLRDLHIVVTRARAQADRLGELLEAHGAEISEFSTIEIAPSGEPLHFGKDDAFDWVVFTSGNAVRTLHEAFEADGRRFVFSGASICAVGPATEHVLHAHRIDVDLIPARYEAAAVPGALLEVETDLTGKRILLPRGDLAEDELPKALRDAGAEVVEYVVYRTVCPEVEWEAVEIFTNSQPQIVTFTSGSTATNFAALLGPEGLKRLGEHVIYASIGPQTTAAAKASGLEVRIEADPHTLDSLADAIVAFIQSSEPSQS